jgi:hypothetical protein
MTWWLGGLARLSLPVPFATGMLTDMSYDFHSTLLRNKRTLLLIPRGLRWTGFYTDKTLSVCASSWLKRQMERDGGRF